MELMLTSALLQRPFPVQVTGDEDKCFSCGVDLDTVYAHIVLLPMRFRNLGVCEDCATGYRIVTECCGDIGTGVSEAE